MKTKALQSLRSLFFDNLIDKHSATPAGQRLLKLFDIEDGWREFLKTVGSKTFTGSFSEFHEQFWNWYWHITNLRKKGLPFDVKRDFLAGWSRENGKSSTVEWACIAEGSVGLEGYVLYVSKTQSSAENHVSAIRKRLESDDIAEYFPDLSAPQIGTFGNQYGWRQNFLMTKSGWAIRPVGLDVAIRGLKEGDLRPSMIVFDDIDDYRMSLADAETNLGTISRSILPSGTKNTIHLIAQNLIAEHCVVNQIYTGATDVLADHIPSIYPAFKELEVEAVIDKATGKSRSVIKHAVPVWDGFDTESAQVYLNKVGLEAFYAEYQHDFSLDQTDKVLPEYQDHPLHVIAWSQFQEKFGTIYRVPKHWQIGVGLDIGFTAEHLSAWTWIAVAAEDSYLPFAHFRFRGKTFTGKSIIDQANAVLEIVKYTDQNGNEVDEREQWTVMVMSHEKEGEQLILNREYEMPFADCKFRREDGLPEWRALLRVDHKQPHPFHEDRLLTEEECLTRELEYGSYLLGRPNFFEVVEDGQEQYPKDDDGLAVQRSQAANWKRKKVKLTPSGVADAVPMKFKDDCNDSARMILAEQKLSATGLTNEQERRVALKNKIRTGGLTLEAGRSDYNGVLKARLMDLREIEIAADTELTSNEQIINNFSISPPAPSRKRSRF